MSNKIHDCARISGKAGLHPLDGDGRGVQRNEAPPGYLPVVEHRDDRWCGTKQSAARWISICDPIAVGQQEEILAFAGMISLPTTAVGLAAFGSRKLLRKDVRSTCMSSIALDSSTPALKPPGICDAREL